MSIAAPSRRKFIFLAALGAVLGGCDGLRKELDRLTLERQVLSLPGVPAVTQDPSASLLSAACTGAHPRGGWRIQGDTMYIMTADIYEIVDGNQTSVQRISAPANWTRSSTAAPIYAPGSRAACRGAALETTAFGNNPAEDSASSHDGIDWRLEFSPAANSPGGTPVQLRGKVIIDDDGTSKDQMPFWADGRQFIAHISVSPGPGYHAAIAKRYGAYADKQAPGVFSRQMPDETPYRTLEDTRRTNTLRR
jgi:hypothetical protein